MNKGVNYAIHRNQSNTTVTAIGTICGILSAAIYAFCEAWVDGKAVQQTDDIFFDDFEDCEDKDK